MSTREHVAGNVLHGRVNGLSSTSRDLDRLFCPGFELSIYTGLPRVSNSVKLIGDLYDR